MKYDYLKEILDSSHHVVALMGTGVSENCGTLNYRTSGKEAYEIELKYGYSPEELFSTSFYMTRPQQFYEFYQKEILNRVGVPGICLKSLLQMEQDGKLDMIITRELFSLARRVGCQHVIELHGSIFENACPHCGKKFDIEYMRQGNPIPYCDNCGTMIRPHVCLMGEMIDNQKITAAAQAVSKADTLMMLGAHFKSILADSCMKYFEGSRLILINKEENYADNIADIIIHEHPRDVLPLIYPYVGRSTMDTVRRKNG